MRFELTTWSSVNHCNHYTKVSGIQRKVLNSFQSQLTASSWNQLIHLIKWIEHKTRVRVVSYFLGCEWDNRPIPLLTLSIFCRFHVMLSTTTCCTIYFYRSYEKVAMLVDLVFSVSVFCQNQWKTFICSGYKVPIPLAGGIIIRNYL